MIARLMKEHAALRKRAAEVESVVGPSMGVGWNDCTVCDLAKLRAAQDGLQKALLEHEDREKRLLTEAFEREGGDPGNFGREIEKSHMTLAHLMGLMRAVSALCDGSHVYAVRNAVERVRQELDAHLAQEERALFPMLNRAKKRHLSKAH